MLPEPEQLFVWGTHLDAQVVGCACAYAGDRSLAERQNGAGGHAVCQAVSQNAPWQPSTEMCCRQQSLLGAACTTWCSSDTFCWLQLLKCMTATSAAGGDLYGLVFSIIC